MARSLTCRAAGVPKKAGGGVSGGEEGHGDLKKSWAEIEEGHRVVERGSAEPPPTQEEHIDNG